MDFRISKSGQKVLFFIREKKTCTNKHSAKSGVWTLCKLMIVLVGSHIRSDIFFIHTFVTLGVAEISQKLLNREEEL